MIWGETFLHHKSAAVFTEVIFSVANASRTIHLAFSYKKKWILYKCYNIRIFPQMLCYTPTKRLKFTMQKKVTIVYSPYHVGIREHRVGNGPKRILSLGLVEHLESLGLDVKIEEIARVDEFEGEFGRSLLKSCVAYRRLSLK